jgi:hypothetical protein
MPGTDVALGPWAGGLHNAAGTGEGIEDDELFELVNLEVDSDKSLANRPAIAELAVTGVTGIASGVRLIGTYLPDDGRKFIVAAVGSVVWLVNADTGVAATSQGVLSSCCVQYKNKLWIIPQTAGQGGFFDAPTSTTLSWTAAGAIPRGDAAVIYKERLFVTGGATGITNNSRLNYSDVGDFATFPGASNVDVVPGNGQRLVFLIVTSQDIYLFKEHSTYKYGYASDPARADITLISTTVGVPAVNCAVVYNNNTMYVLHDNSVYELYNGAYTKISTNIAMEQTLDADLFGADTYALTLYRNRLFVRFYSRLYVFNLELQRWSSWETLRKFSKLVVLQRADTGLDTAYAATASSALPGKIFFFRDDRITGVGTVEDFECRIVTKLFDFSVPTHFKRLFYGGLQIATSGTTLIRSMVPNAAKGDTWVDAFLRTWNPVGKTWGGSGSVIHDDQILPAQGAYARKVVKCLKKMRFRQVQFTISTGAEANTVANSSVRIYDLTVSLLQAETIVRGTT